MMGIKVCQEKMFYNFSLSQRVPEEHFLRKVERVVNLRFVRELCEPYYSHTGQPSIDPEVLFKMMLIGYFYGISSERRLAEDIAVNLAYLWYLGYDLDEPTPNHSVISKARVRYGKEVFEEFFQKILSQCVQAGLVKCEKVFMDSTLIEANASLKSIVPRSESFQVQLSPKEYVEKIYAENPVKDEKGVPSEIQDEQKEATLSSGVQDELWDFPVYESQKSSETKNYREKHLSNLDYVSKTDPEASLIGRPGMGLNLFYKDHFAIDSGHRVITAVCVSEGSVDDGKMFKELLERQSFKPKEVCGDSKYGTAENFHYAFENGILPSIPRWTRPPIKKAPNQCGREEFKYDREKDLYWCPVGKGLGKSAFHKHSQQWIYRSRGNDCKSCEFRSHCLAPSTNRRSIARHLYQDDLDRALEHLQTPHAQQSIRERKFMQSGVWLRQRPSMG